MCYTSPSQDLGNTNTSNAGGGKLKKRYSRFLVFASLSVSLLVSFYGCETKEVPKEVFPDGRAPTPMELKEGELVAEAMDLVDEGKKQLEEGDLEGALETFRKASVSDYYNADAYYYTAKTLRALGREKDGFLLFTYALKRFPKGIEKHFYEPEEVDPETSLTPEKLRDLRREITRKPNDQETLRAYITAMIRAGGGFQTREMAEKLVALYPSTDNYMLLLEILMAFQEYDLAIETCRQGIKKGASKGTLLAAIGACHLNMNERGEARKHYLMALKEDPEEATALIHLGNIFLEDKVYNEALNYFRQAVKTQEGNPEFLSRLAWLESYHLNFEEAYKWAYKAFQIDPNQSFEKASVGQIAAMALNMGAQKKIKELTQENDTSAIPQLLSDENPYVRMWAIKKMAQFQTWEHGSLLKGLFTDVHEEVRLEVEKALVEIRSEESLRFLEEATDDLNPTIRGAAIVGFALAEPGKAMKKFRNLADSPYPYIRMSVYYALIQIKTPEAEKLFDELVEKEWNPRITKTFRDLRRTPEEIQDDAPPGPERG
jgi:tetratricopeptide (TPR) repeat protein